MIAYIGEVTGLYRPIEGSQGENRRFSVEYVTSVVACVFIMFCYIIHPNSMSPSLAKTVTRAMNMTPGEMRLFDAIRAIHELESKIGLGAGV